MGLLPIATHISRADLLKTWMISDENTEQQVNAHFRTATVLIINEWPATTPQQQKYTIMITKPGYKRDQTSNKPTEKCNIATIANFCDLLSLTRARPMMLASTPVRYLHYVYRYRYWHPPRVYCNMETRMKSIYICYILLIFMMEKYVTWWVKAVRKCNNASLSFIPNQTQLESIA